MRAILRLHQPVNPGGMSSRGLPLSVILPESEVNGVMDDSRRAKLIFASHLSRFQQKQYANIEIVLTEKKGYGLRVEADIPKYVRFSDSDIGLTLLLIAGILSYMSMLEMW